MGYIVQWLNQQAQAKAATKIVDDTVESLKRREGILDMVMPLETYDSRHFLGYLMTEVNTIASVIGIGTEAPLTQQGAFKKVTAELMKTGLARVYTEDYQWQMKEAMEEAAMKNMYVQSMRDPKTGKVIKGVNHDLARYIFGTIESLAKSQIDLIDKMTWDALQTGQINHTDPRTGLPVIIDYRDPTLTAQHFPAPLVGPQAWTSSATANGLADLETLVETFVQGKNGFAPKAIALSRKGLRNLLNQQSTKDAATSVRGSSVGSVSNEMLQTCLEARQLPSIITFDERYTYEAEDKTTSQVRFMQENRVVMLTEEMGVRAIGPTLENNGGESGIYTRTRQVNDGTVVDKTETYAHLLPVLLKPSLLMSQQVF
jgi:hypothetical protein